MLNKTLLKPVLLIFYFVFILISIIVLFYSIKTIVKSKSKQEIKESKKDILLITVVNVISIAYIFSVFWCNIDTFRLVLGKNYILSDQFY